MEPTRRDLLRLLACSAAACPFVGAARALAQAGAPHEALYWEDAGEKRIKCVLCPRECVVADLERGTCGVRENRGGKYYTLVYGQCAALNLDPIEKKPLFHFLPGSSAFSIATAGCNFDCKDCQNWEISQTRPEQIPNALDLPPADVAAIGHLVRGQFEGHVVGDLSHLLRPDPGSAGPREYRRAVRRPVSPEYLELVTGWVTKRWGRSGLAVRNAPPWSGAAPGDGGC